MLSSFVYAITPTGLETQQLLRQQKRERQLEEQQQQEADERSESHKVVPPALLPSPIALSDKLPRNESPCFVISQILLEGEAAEQFQWARDAANPKHDPVLGQCIGAEGINLVIARVQQAIIQRGFITTRHKKPPYHFF